MGGSEADLLHLLWCVQHGPDDHHPVQQVQGDAMWRGDVLGAPARAKITPITQGTLRPWTTET